MNLNYSQTTGAWTDEQGKTIATGWAGCGDGKNNPAMQGEHNIGPLPQGLYVMGSWHDHPNLGPLVAELIQIEGDNLGRGAFYCHGPAANPDKYGQESHGCAVVPRPDRLKIIALTPSGNPGGHRVRVTA